MQDHSSIELRLKHLNDNIEQDLALRKKYEDALRYEDDPRRTVKYQREIDKLWESANRYRQELDELRKQIPSEQIVSRQDETIQLQQLDTKLDRLSAGQKAIYENINYSRKGLLARYNTGEQNIIAAIAQRLEQAQINTIFTVLDALEANQVTEEEMQVILQSIQQSLTTLQQHGTALSPSQQAVAEALNTPGLDIKHRLKFSLPIISFLLDYEGELELGKKLSLQALWQTLLVKFRGE